MHAYFINFILGFIASMLGSMSGLGGGFLAIPVLYYIGIPIQFAAATSKFMAFVNSVVSSFQYLRKIRLSIGLYISVATPMILMAYLGAYFLAILPEKMLSLIIGLILFIGALRIILLPSEPSRQGTVDILSKKMYAQGILSGSIAGLLGGVSGLGGGVINVPLLICFLKLDVRIAISLSMACIMPSALSSVIRHVIDNVILWDVGIPMSMGAVIGGILGPHLALRVRKETLRKIIGGIILSTTIRIVTESILYLLL